jgi:hypothetical protein
MQPFSSAPEPFLEIAGQFNLKNFDYCICFLLNLCYGVYIPVEAAVAYTANQGWKWFASLASRHEQLHRSCRLFLRQNRRHSRLRSTSHRDSDESG